MADDSYAVLVSLGRCGMALGDIGEIMAACGEAQRQPTPPECQRVSDLAAQIRAELATVLEEQAGPHGVTDLAAGAILAVQEGMARPAIAGFVSDCQIEAGLAMARQQSTKVDVPAGDQA